MPPPDKSQKFTSPQSLDPILGRVPPHSEDAEEYLLSCCFLDGRDVIARCLEERIGPESFYNLRNRTIFEKLLDLEKKNLPIDLQIVAEELKTSQQLDEVGGYAYLAKLGGMIPTTAQVGYFIDKVKELALLRKLIHVATQTVEECYNYTGELESFVDGVEQRVFGVTQDRITDGAKQMEEATHQAMGVVNKLLMEKGKLSGISSGFKDLDALTYGFQKQEMIVLAARPSMGKTSLALNFAEAAALPRGGGKGAGTLIFSLEMGASQLALRMLCSRSRVNMKLLRDGLLPRKGEELQKLEACADEFAKSPIYIDDSSKLTIMELRAKARRVAAKAAQNGTPLGFIVVDYLQLLTPVDARVAREQQVAEMSRGLKALAKELDVPVLVLSQLNRSAEKENRTPKLSDLRESGAIEQDADVVLMLARPKDENDKFQVAGDSAELIIAKNRNGAVGELNLTFLRNITRFENYTGENRAANA